MPQVNHFRRFVPKQKKAEPQAFAVTSFCGAVDPAFDDLERTEEEITSRLRDRGTL